MTCINPRPLARLEVSCYEILACFKASIYYVYLDACNCLQVIGRDWVFERGDIGCM